MPFGLVSASFAFSKMLGDVLEPLKGEKVFSYLDDVLVCADSLEEMERRLRRVLEKFREFKLRINPEKMIVCSNEVVFLGHTLTSEGVLPAVDKLKALELLQPPKNLKELLSFVALASFFHKFVINLSELVEPMLRLTRKNVKFVFDKECMKSFVAIKTALTNPIILAHASEIHAPNAKAILLTDASDVSVGAYLGVLVDNELKLVAFASRVMNKAERRYSTFHREFLAIKEAVTNFFAHILINCEFVILTDHRPLISLFNSPIDLLDARSCRWKMKLSRFVFKIHFISGTKNAVADALSRLCDGRGLDSRKVPVKLLDIPAYAVTRAQLASNVANMDEITIEQVDEQARQFAEDVKKNEERQNETCMDISYDEERTGNTATQATGNVRILTDRKEIKKLIEAFHLSPLSGHLGARRMKLKLSECFRWKNMAKDLSDYV